MSVISPEERDKRVRLAARAQSKAKIDLAHKYELEYRELYLKYRDELFYMYGLIPGDPRFR